jgi:predicted PurR-regulated permease PerM
MEEIKQKKKMLLEVVLVIAFLFLVVCGVIFVSQKIFESKPVQSTISFIQNEPMLIKQYWDNTQTSITNIIDETQYSLNEKAPWLKLRKRPQPQPEPIIENLSSESQPQGENPIGNEISSTNSNPVQANPSNKN